MTKSYTFIQPLDRIAIAMMLILSLIIGLMIWKGDAVRPHIRDFTWQNQKISADDISFTLTFSRPMDIESVKENLKIDPPLAGKISWAGRRMVYTLLTPAPYGTNYKLELQNAQDKFSKRAGNNKLLQPFTGKFSTRDRAIIYIGANPEEKGQLVLYNLTKEQRRILTPKNLVVMDFEPFPDGEKIVFSARKSDNLDILSAQIYTVTTGITNKVDVEPEPPGTVELLLDNQNYQNLKFDLAPDGSKIIIQRGKTDNPGDFGLWSLPTTSDNLDEKPTATRLKSQVGGDFIITPDSKAIAVAQGQGTAIISLQSDTTKPVDFLPQFGLVQAFSKDGSQAAMVKFNTDFTRDLFLVTNQGVQKQLLKTNGSIVSCQFDNASPTLYCLLTQLVSQEQYAEQPYLVAINLKNQEEKPKPLLVLPPSQRNIQMSLAPDGLGLLFDQIVPVENNSNQLPANTPTTESGEPISSSTLWLMPLLPIADTDNDVEIKPEQLPFIGFNPQWLP